MFGAKLSWYQIIRCQIVLVPNCPGPDCPCAKFSGCQIVCFLTLGAKLSGAKFSGAKLSGAKLSTIPEHSPSKKKRRKSTFIIQTMYNFSQAPSSSGDLARKELMSPNVLKLGKFEFFRNSSSISTASKIHVLIGWYRKECFFVLWQQNYYLVLKHLWGVCCFRGGSWGTQHHSRERCLSLPLFVFCFFFCLSFFVFLYTLVL